MADTKKPALTPWFPADVKPVRVGVYETKPSHCSPDGLFQLWDGSGWGWCHVTPRQAVMPSKMPAPIFGPIEWRGLTKEAR